MIDVLVHEHGVSDDFVGSIKHYGNDSWVAKAISKQLKCNEQNVVTKKFTLGDNQYLVWFDSTKSDVTVDTNYIKPHGTCVFTKLDSTKQKKYDSLTEYNVDELYNTYTFLSY